MTFVATKIFHKAGEGSGGDSHNLGWYATKNDLETAHATAEAGDWAIVGTTDTVWVWDTDTSAWVDTGQKGQVTSVNNQTGDVTIGANDVLPSQTGYSGRVLGTDGFVAGWVKPEIVQRSTMPVANQDEEGNVYQFIGTTDANYTNGYFYKCVSDGQNPATYSWTQTDVQPAPSGLPDQTGQSGKFLTTDGTDASWSIVKEQSGNFTLALTTVHNGDTVANTGITARQIVYGMSMKLNNYEYITAIGRGWYVGGTYSVSIGVGVSNKPTGQYSVAIGGQTKATGQSAVSIGNNTSVTANQSVAIGAFSESSAQYCVAIGQVAKSTSIGAIQLGLGTNANAGTLSIGLTPDGSNWNNYELLSADGTIPTDRFTTTPVADGTYVPTLTISSGVATRTWAAPSGGGTPTTATATLAVNDWSSNTQTVNVTGVTASNTVFVAPAPASNADFVAGGIVCTAQASGTLTFTCTTTPTSAITVNVCIFG